MIDGNRTLAESEIEIPEDIQAEKMLNVVSFQLEAQISQQLNTEHVNILSLYKFGYMTYKKLNKEDR